MSYEWLEEYCLAKPGAVKEWKEEWEVFRYMVGGKMFLMDGDNGKGTLILTLKLEPLHGELARSTYPCIMPGHYMNKVHWNSILREGDLPDDMLKSYLDESYKLVLSSLPKKLQKELLGE